MEAAEVAAAVALLVGPLVVFKEEASVFWGNFVILHKINPKISPVFSYEVYELSTTSQNLVV